MNQIMQILIYGAAWITLIHFMLKQILTFSQEQSMKYVKFISLFLITFKLIEYGTHWIQGDFTKIPVEYSAITYFLFSITFLFNIEKMKPFVTFAAFISGLGYLLVFPFLGSAFIEVNGLTSTLLVLLNHSLLYVGSVLVMKNYKFSPKSRKMILIYTGALLSFSIAMQYLINFENSYIFLYMILDGRILHNMFANISIDGFIYLSYHLILVFIYLTMISLFYKTNSSVYQRHENKVSLTSRKEIITYEHTI